MSLPKPYPPTKIDYSDWDTVIDALEARLGTGAVVDLLMADTTAIKTGIVDDDYFDIEVVDNDTNALVVIARVQGAANPYIGFGSSQEFKFYADGTSVQPNITGVTTFTAGGNLDIGSYSVQATQFISDIAIGTAPFVVTSTTVVSNLNADQVDGKESTALVLVDGTQALTANWDAGAFDIRALSGTFDSLTSGRVPIASTNGLLIDNAGLLFDTLTATLTSTNIAAFTLGGKLTAGSSEIEGSVFDINGGTIDGITSLTVANNVDIGAFDIRALTGTFDSLTSGRVPFVSTDGLLVDEAGFTYNSGTDTLAATNIAGSVTDSGLTAGRVVFASAGGELSDDADLTFATDTLTFTKGKTTELTLDLTQDYLFTERSTSLVIQGQSSGIVSTLELFTKDGDGTDDNYLRMFGVGIPTDITNIEYLDIGYVSGTQWIIESRASGTGTLRPIVIYTEGNTNQLKLNIDGSVQLSAGMLQLDTNNKLQLRDSALYIASLADTYIDYVADGAHRFSGNVAIGANEVTRTRTPATLAAAATAIAAVGEYMIITGDGGGNTVATITGGSTGQTLILEFVDALVTITDTDAATADTVNLSAAFTSSANDVLTLINTGTKWLELSRSVN